MKKIILLLLVVVIFAASCKRSKLIVSPYYDIPVSSPPFISGNFVITKFANSISNEDSTAAFNGYVFSFGSDGKVTAIKDNQTISGTYKETHTLDNKLELGFYFYNRPFSYLNGNWWVTSISDTSIKLSGTSTGYILEFNAQ